VVLVPVSKEDADDIIHAVFEVAKVRKDHVDAGLVFFRKENATVDDENLAVDLENGHVATDLSDATKRDDAEDARTQWSRCRKGLNQWFSFLFGCYALLRTL
jgi:hypothetical protein